MCGGMVVSIPFTVRMKFLTSFSVLPSLLVTEVAATLVYSMAARSPIPILEFSHLPASTTPPLLSSFRISTF